MKIMHTTLGRTLTAAMFALMFASVAFAGTLNNAGNHVFNAMQVSDGTGFAVTVAAAGTYVAMTHATLIDVVNEDGSACITDTVTSGRFTIAACGAGKVRVRACLNDAIGANSATWTAALHRTRAASATQIGPILRETEGATAARDSEGCIEYIDDAASGDTYDLRFDSGTNADTVTVRQASFQIEKLTN